MSPALPKTTKEVRTDDLGHGAGGTRPRARDPDRARPARGRRQRCALAHTERRRRDREDPRPQARRGHPARHRHRSAPHLAAGQRGAVLADDAAVPAGRGARTWRAGVAGRVVASGWHVSEGLSELGLRAELVAAVAERGFDAPSALQRAAIPVLRRGGNAVLHASYGSGLTAAYGLALLDRFADAGDGGPQTLIVTPSGARAVSAADELAALAGTLNLRIAALAPGWRNAETANVVCGSLQDVAGAIGRSALKLESRQAVVLESLSTLLDEGSAELDAIMTAVPREAQRVITTAAYDPRVVRFVEQHARRAISIPARPAARAAGTTEPAGEVHYLVVPEFDKDDALARLLVRSSGEAVLVTTRSARRAELVRGLLAARGYDTKQSDTLRVESAIEAPPRGARVIAYDAPMR